MKNIIKQIMCIVLIINVPLYGYEPNNGENFMTCYCIIAGDYILSPSNNKYGLSFINHGSLSPGAKYATEKISLDGE